MSQMAPIGPINLEGIIRQSTWHPPQNISSIPGIPNRSILGYRSRAVTMPAHYKLQLDEVEVNDKEEYSKLMGYGVMVSHGQDDGFLAVGMHIRIYGLRMLGDETGVVAFFDRIEILNSPVE